MVPLIHRCLLPAAVYLLLAGCGSEVAYNTPPAEPPAAEGTQPQGTEAEAPPFDPAAPAEETPPAEEPAAELTGEETAPLSETPTEGDTESALPPAEEDDAATPAPWQADREATAEESTNTASAAPEQAEQDFGALFNEMLSETKKDKQPAENSTAETSEPPTTAPPADETPAPETADSAAKSGAPEWKMPWENDGAKAEPPVEPPAEEKPPTTESATLNDEPPAEETPATNPDVDVDSLFGNDLSTPAESQPKAPPETIAEQAAPETTADPAPAAPPVSTEPAESITVDPTNTRHLAWLFGAKFSLSLLASEKNSTTDQQVVWQTETAKLAGALGLAAPTATGSGPPAERVPQLLAESQKVGAELATKHGVEAAALVELAVKSNLLLGLEENRRTFAPVIAKSLRSAAGRTSVPADVWESPLTEIAAAKDNAGIEQAVYELHKRMEASLRSKAK